MGMEYEALLNGHILYGLDQVIVAYLGPILEQKLGKPFQLYRVKQQAYAKKKIEMTYQFGLNLVRQPVREIAKRQEQLIVEPMVDQELRDTLQNVMRTAKEAWQELFILYDEALTESIDLTSMTAAQQAAEEGHDDIHASVVRQVLGLKDTLAPVWWTSK